MPFAFTSCFVLFCLLGVRKSREMKFFHLRPSSESATGPVISQFSFPPPTLTLSSKAPPLPISTCGFSIEAGRKGQVEMGGGQSGVKTV